MDTKEHKTLPAASWLTLTITNVPHHTHNSHKHQVTTIILSPIRGFQGKLGFTS